MSSADARDDILEYIRKSRAQQGLPPTVTDPITLAKAAALIDAVMSIETGRQAG